MNKTTTSKTSAAATLCVRAGFSHEGGNVYTSREGGDGTEGIPSPATISRARAIAKNVIALGFKARVETCDECVSIVVTE